MKIVNIGIRLLLSFLMVYVPVQVQADEIINNAQKNIDKSLELAEADALVLIKEDYMKLIGGLAQEIAREKSTNNLYKAYEKYIGEATVVFQELSKQGATKAQTWEKIEEYQEKYRKGIRSQFVASWIPAEVEAMQANTRAMIQTLMEGFKQQCEVGRGNAAHNYKVPSINVPPYVSSLNGRLNPNPFAVVSGGSPVLWSYSYTSATAGSKAANHDRAVAVNAAVTASNIANAAWVSSQFSALVGTSSAMASAGAAGSAMATVNAALVAAAPYLLAVAVVVMVVADLMGRSEAAKLANRIDKANKMMGEHIADHLDVQGFYRAQCAEYSELLGEFAAVFADLEDSEKKAERLEKSEALKPEIEEWQQASQENKVQICQSNLSVTYDNHGCTQMPADVIPAEWIKDHEMDEEKPKTMCLIDADKKVIEAATGSCLIPFAEAEREKVVKESREALKKYEEKYPKEKVTELVAARLTMTFADPGEITRKIKNVSLDRLNTMQEKAFANVLQLIRIQREIQGLTTSQKVLQAEMAAQNQYTQYRGRLILIGNEIQDLIFGKGSKSEITTKLIALEFDMEEFVDQYYHVDEVVQLEQAVKYISKLVEEL